MADEVVRLSRPGVIRKLREEALAQNKRFFEVQWPCIKGHQSKRYVKGGVCGRCVTCYLEDSKKRYRKNKPRLQEYSKQYRLKNKADIKSKAAIIYRQKSLKERRKGALSKYGMTLEEYEIQFSKQDGKCLICEKSHPVLHVDHDHQTNDVRGLLCNACNAGLGFFRESAWNLSMAITYLGREPIKKGK